MKKSVLFLTLFTGALLSGAALPSAVEAHDNYYGRGPGHYGRGYGYGGRAVYGGGYPRGPVYGGQVFLSTPGFSIGFGSPAVVRPYRPRPVYVPVYPDYYRPGCGW